MHNPETMGWKLTFNWSTKTKLDLIALSGAIPASLAFQMSGGIYGWCVYVLAFYAFVEASPYDCFRRALLVGIGAGFINFGWMLFAGERFTGESVFYSLAIVLAITCVLALYLGLIGLTYGLLKRKMLFVPDSSFSLVNAVILASIFVLYDFLMIHWANGFALVLYVSYISVATDLYAIQPASIFGPLAISFIVVLINGMLAHILYHRVWKLLIFPISVLVIYYAFGFFILRGYENQKNILEPFTAAIISENVAPEFKWSDQNGNALIERLFHLTKNAVSLKPRLMVWSETVIPWNFRYDDPFLLELSKLTSIAGITHLVGMNTDYNEKTYYNSVYCLEPKFKITGRYDKRLALNLLEKPFLGIVLPFYNDNGFQIIEGVNDAPLTTAVGAAGVLLCNESTIPSLAYRSVSKGAQFLVNPGNDGWFSETYIAKQHFYHARLRAVETRRDVIINNNSGYVGLVRANGEIAKMEKKSTGFVSIVEVRPSNYLSYAVRFPYAFVMMIAAILLVLCAVPAKWLRHCLGSR